jgi:crotonobetainyl-CoA:carnitine CoA-transferase CaiB-like acyl-CoA transferase
VSTKPLSGIRILDFSRFLSGPYGTMLLGDLGAEVLKVEDSARGDPLRVQGPPFFRGEGVTYHASNRNKKSLQANLKDPEHLKRVRELCDAADVVVENFRPGVMDQFGLHYDALKATNPRLIYASISGYGADGPLAGQGAFDLTIQAYGGYMSITGEENGPPVKPGTSAFDLISGMNLCTAVLAAVLHRVQTGQGQRIETSLLEGQVAFLANAALEYLYGFGVPGRLGSGHPQLVPYKVFRTADGYLVIGAGVQNIWESLARALGRADLIEHPKFKDLATRVANRAFCNETVEGETSKHTTESLAVLLDAAGVPCSPVNTMDKVFAEEQVLHRQMVVPLAKGTVNEVATVGSSVKYSAFEITEGWSLPPALGEGGEELASRWLAPRER